MNIRNEKIDFRSDTVTVPTEKMLDAMRSAKVGDDVFHDDPTINLLEEKAAFMTGKEAAMFAVSGTQTNLCALLTHCGRGDEVILGENYHTYKWEGGGMAVLGGIQPQTVPVAKDGKPDIAAIENAVKPIDPHFARSELIVLENTCQGRAIDLEFMVAVSNIAKKNGLGMHLDGARIFNACTHENKSIAEMVAPFDSASICLSKGLCAPIGSLLVGSREFISEARRWRKVVGGGIRQGGYMAAASIIALEEMHKRFHEDHENAAYLAAEFAKMEKIVDSVEYSGTNMLFVSFNEDHREQFVSAMTVSGITLLPRNPIRMICHKDTDRSKCDYFLEMARRFHDSI